MKKLLFFLIVFYLSLLVISCSGGGGGESSSTSDKIDTLLGDSDPDASGGSSSSDTSVSCLSSSDYTKDSSSTISSSSTVSDNSSITSNSYIDNSTVRQCSRVVSCRIDNSTISNSTLSNCTITNSIIDNATIDNSTIDNSTIDDSIIDNDNITDHTLPDTVPPTADDTDPSGPADGDDGVSANTGIRVTFSEPMDPDTITTITSGTDCTGTFQVSTTANFTDGTCVRMTASPVPTNGNKTFTVTPASSLNKGDEYFVKIISGNSGVKDKFGNNLSSDIEISFETSSS